MFIIVIPTCKGKPNFLPLAPSSPDALPPALRGPLFVLPTGGREQRPNPEIWRSGSKPNGALLWTSIYSWDWCEKPTFTLIINDDNRFWHTPMCLPCFKMTPGLPAEIKFRLKNRAGKEVPTPQVAIFLASSEVSNSWRLSTQARLWGRLGVLKFLRLRFNESFSISEKTYHQTGTNMTPAEVMGWAWVHDCHGSGEVLQKNIPRIFQSQERSHKIIIKSHEATIKSL